LVPSASAPILPLANVVRAARTFSAILPIWDQRRDGRTLNTIDIGLLKVAPDADVNALVKVLRQRLKMYRFGRKRVCPKELDYWRENTSIGFVFSHEHEFYSGRDPGVSNPIYVAEHWAEYATLKAISYSNYHLLGIVLQESVILVF